MANQPITATQCFDGKTKEEEKRVEKAFKRYRELILPTLPRAKGWVSEPLYRYQGFWFSSKQVEGVMYLQDHLKARPTDVIVTTHPKCGTTWIKSLVFSIMHRAYYPINMEEHPLLTLGVHECVPFLEGHLFPDFPIGDPEVLPSPRVLCTHSPYTILPESAKGPDGCRIVYVWRDPKDVLVSLWHFNCNWRKKLLVPGQLSLEEAFDSFSKGISPYGAIWDHVLGFWKPSVEYPNKILILKYEDMKADTVYHVKKLAEFLGQPFTVEEEERGIVHEIIKLCSFKTLSKAEPRYEGTFHDRLPDYQDYFRKGEVGDFKNLLTTDMIRRLDEITEEKFKGTGLPNGKLADGSSTR